MRKLVFPFWLLTFLASHLTPAGAEPFNYGQAPLGVQSSGRGGVNAAWGGDASAVFFNPAGLGLLSPGQWNGVVSGFAEYGQATQKTVFTDKDVSGKTLDGMLTYAGAVRGTSWGGVGLAFVVPERLSVKTLKRYEDLKFGEDQSERQFPSGSVSMNTDVTTFLLGPAAAWRAWPEVLSIGLHGFYSLRSAHTGRTVFIKVDPDTSVGLETVTQQISQAFQVGLGFWVRPFHALSLGAAADYTLPVKNSFTVSRALVSVDKERLRELAGEVVTGRTTIDQATTELDRFIVTPEVSSTREDYRQPLSVRVGPRVDLPTGTSLGFDVVWYAAERQYTRMRALPGFDPETQVVSEPCDPKAEEKNPFLVPEVPAPFHCSKQEAIVNVHFGAEQTLRPGLVVAAGFYTDFSNHPSISALFEEEGEERRELTDQSGFQIQAPSEVNVYHLTAGVSLRRGAMLVSPALSYGWGSGATLSIAPVQKRKELRRDVRAGLGVSFDF
ncbi:MAG: hypothetical protein HYT87_14615 [Nitrospirae bacterium]|nr:hypothetical protein [Nitrospirota bacterium]